MDTIKNILSGHKHDDDLSTGEQRIRTSDPQSGTGHTSELTSGTTGEGSHLTENRDTLGTRNPGSQNTTLTALGRNQNNEISSGTAEAQDTGLTNQTDLRTDPDLDGSRNTGGVVSKISEGYGTNTSGAFPDDPTRNTTSAGSELAASDTVGKNPAMDTNLGSSTAKVTSSGAGHGTSNTSEGNTGFGGPHKSEAANRLDPSVNTSREIGLESAHHHSRTHGGGAEEADRHHNSLSGRDATVGGGNAGLAEHEHRMHEQDHRTMDTSAPEKTSLGQSRRPTDYASGAAAGAQQSHLGRGAAVEAQLNYPGKSELRKHQYERGTGFSSAMGTSTRAHELTGRATGQQSSQVEKNAAVVSGGTGLAEYELNKDDNNGGSGAIVDSSTTGTKIDSSTASDPSHPHKSHLANIVDPRVDPNMDGSRGHTSDPYTANKQHHGMESGIEGPAISTATGRHSSSLTTDADAIESDHSKDTHNGRDAVVAGGVGTAAYEADQHHQKHDKDLTLPEREAKKEHKRELKEEKRERKESKRGILSFLHRDKTKKYSPEEEAEFDRQEREHNAHEGRDALGEAAVGSAAYEADKHYRDHLNTTAIEGDINKPLPAAPGNHGIGTGEGTGNALAGDNSTSKSSDHHPGGDAAAFGGAGALGEHQRNRASGTTTLTQGSTNAPLDYKPRGTDLGDKLHGVERNRGIEGSTGFPEPGSGFTTTGTTSTSGQHDHGHDATIVGGAAALGEHERRKHDLENVGSTRYNNQSTSITDASMGARNEPYLSHDSAVGAGGIGSAGHERRKHEDGTGLEYNSNVTGSKTTGGIGGDKNRLHKDPPADHPAAQGT